jgi:hypothetical protein
MESYDESDDEKYHIHGWDFESQYHMYATDPMMAHNYPIADLVGTQPRTTHDCRHPNLLLVPVTGGCRYSEGGC